MKGEKMKKMKGESLGKVRMYSYGHIITRCLPRRYNRCHTLHLLHRLLDIDKRVTLLPFT